jgi:two-component system, OmpR family, alkaline phosphatase synthesis response regulator PhoP
MRPNVLLVEDEEALRMTVGDRLRTEGYLVDYATNGDEGFEKATHLPFDLIILDLMLPHRDGLSMCRDLRSAGLITPILMLTARGLTEDKVLGLKTGGDDYVTKPFDMQELVARVEALLRRVPIGSVGSRGVYHFGAIRVDRRATEVTRDGEPVNLSIREFQLLKYFIDNAGVTLSREQLLTDVWGYNAKIFTRTVDVHVASLRQKLESDPKQPLFIQTIQRVGYKFTPGVATS